MRTRMSRLVLAAGAVGLSLTLLSAGPAGAAQPKQSLGQAGSDTTYFMMGPIAKHYMASSADTNHDIITEIPPINCPGANTNCSGANVPFPASVTVPADSVHPAMTWDSSSAAATPPNGSSAGITALQNDKTGQIAFGRSSRGPNPGETAKINFWAYALGAVDYVTFPNTDAPAKGLTQAQLIGIYTCNPSHAPAVLLRLEPGRRQAGRHRAVRAAGRLGHVELLPDEAAERRHGRPEL